ncbi:MAG: flippase [Candidatus Methanofastidiosa archaeon]|nr:flippase [Candidatus Methanofastidiosa archaeon]
MIKKSLMLLIANSFSRVSNYLFTIFTANILLLTEYGLLSAIMPFQSLILVFSSFGIAPSVSRFTSIYSSEGKKDKISASLLFVPIGIVLFLILISLSPIIKGFYSPDIREGIEFPLKIILLVIPLGVLFSVFTGILLGLKKVNYMATSIFVLSFSYFLLSVPLSYYFRVAGASASLVGGYLVGIIAAFLFVTKSEIKLKIKIEDFQEFKKIFIFAVPVSIFSLSLVLLFNADIYMLAHFFGPETVGIYGMASPTAGIVPSFAIALSAILLPELSKAKIIGKNEVGRISSSLSASFNITLPVALSLFAFSNPIIYFLFGVKEGGGVLKLLSLAMLFYSLFYVASTSLQALEKQTIPMKITVLIAGINIILNYLLIPRYNINGAALATMISCIIGMILIIKSLGISFIPEKRFFLFSLAIFILMIAFENAVGIFPERLVNLFTYGAFGTPLILGYFYYLKKKWK